MFSCGDGTAGIILLSWIVLHICVRNENDLYDDHVITLNKMFRALIT